MLNRIIRVDSLGLHYEADPRHAELLIKSLGFENSNGVSAPGDKTTDIDYDAILDDITTDFGQQPPLAPDNADDEPMPQPIASLAFAQQAKPRPHKRISFDNNITTHHITPYAECYVAHPRKVVATAHGWKRVSSKADPYTGKSLKVMSSRRALVYSESRLSKAFRE